MNKSPLTSYFIFLCAFCFIIIIGVKMLGEQGTYLVQLYI